MSRITLAQAAQWCGGTVDPKYAQISFLGASNDSRSVKPGQLFVALEGVRDGHDFIPAALAAGADRLPWETLVDPVPFSRYQEAVMTFQPLAKG